MIPSFLKNAKPVSQSNQQPSFLKNARAVEKQNFPLENENDLEREIERNQAQITSRGLETILGLPGDVYSFGKELFGYSPETSLPTSQSLRKFSEEASLGYTKPKTEFEEKVGNVASDVAGMAIPGSKIYGFARNLGIPLAANLVKEGLKYSGADEESASAAKIGSMVLLDLMAHRQGGVRKFAGDLFEKTKSMIPETLEMPAGNLEASLNAIKNDLSRGGKRTSTIKSLEKINEILDEVHEGKINVRNLYEYRPSINEAIQELGGFDLNIPKPIKRKIIRNLGNVKSEVIKGVEEGLYNNKDALKSYKEANEAWSAYEKSQLMKRFLEKTLGGTVKGKIVKSILGLGGSIGGSMLGGPLVTGAVGLTGAGVYNTQKILRQIMGSNALRRYYFGVLKGAAAGNAAQVKKNAKALDQSIQQED